MKRLSTLLLTTLLLAACSTKDKNVEVEEETGKQIEEDVKKEKIEEESSSENEEQDDDRLKIGETAEIDGIKFTVNNAEFTEERIPDHFETFEYVLKLDVTYENTTDETFPAGRDVVLKANGEDATYYDMADILLTDVEAHDSVTGSLYYAFNGQPEELIAVFEPLLNEDKETAQFDVMPK